MCVVPLLSTGLVYDLISSFAVAFFVMAAMEATIGLMFLAMPRIKHYYARRQLKEEEQEVQAI